MWNRALNVKKRQQPLKTHSILAKDIIFASLSACRDLNEDAKWREQSQVDFEFETFQTFLLALFAISRLSQAIIIDNGLKCLTEFSVFMFANRFIQFYAKDLFDAFHIPFTFFVFFVVNQVSLWQSYYQVLNICIVYQRTNVAVYDCESTRVCGYIEN